jgi:hypothetical protein
MAAAAGEPHHITKAVHVILFMKIDRLSFKLEAAIAED